MEIKHRSELYKIIDLSLPVAELGCAEGYFSADILSWGVKKLYMVDNWATIPNQKGDGGYDQNWHDQNYDKAIERVSKYNGRVKILRGMTTEMASNVPNESLGMVYLDADHSYEGVMKDLVAWYPKVVKGGIVAGHDFLMSHYGVNRAVHEFADPYHLEVHTVPENKPDDAGFYFTKPL